MEYALSPYEREGGNFSLHNESVCGDGEGRGPWTYWPDIIERSGGEAEDDNGASG